MSSRHGYDWASRPYSVKWEYRLIGLGPDRDLAKLNAAGEDGWEAVAVEHGYALCKRKRF